ncbi:MAG: NUDIX domain-containing protein [Candidatus Komeilibacteria bacterium]|nr:NUDIX domain-containing protein [Candidatus Komeilibacteria bacterium]
MSEIINTYLLNDPETVIAMDRQEFYDEQIKAFKKTGQPIRANEIVDIFVFNSSGELLVQKRSDDKAHNPGLLDKSVGGHISFGNEPDFTVMVETVQELQAPSIVLKNDVDYRKTINLLNDYLKVVSVIKYVNTKIYKIEKIINGQKILIANRIHAYFGVYDGSVKPVDREARGILWYSLKELDDEMKRLPETFSCDMHALFKELRPEIEEFLELLAKQKKS